MKTIVKTWVTLALSGILVACGGGGDSDSTPDTPPVVPPPPTQSPPPPEKASRFLYQASFGPTRDSIADVEYLGFEGWIDQQTSYAPTYHEPYFFEVTIEEGNTYSQFVNAWWDRSLTADDQLRQRVAFALSQIMVVSSHGVSDGGFDGARSLSNYYDILLRNAFGNYRTLIEDVTLSPVMGEYLSMLRNEKPDLEKNIRPDENYARELMQLFSIGLVELNLDGTIKTDGSGQPIPTYTQEDIVGLAHVFTGWTWANAEKFRWWSEDRDLMSPMRSFADYHDTGEKRILGGVIIPANQTPEQDLKQALDTIFEHPNVGPFISKQLIQKLVTSNPSPSYVERVAAVFNNNGQGVRGDLKAVVKAILLDNEAQEGVSSHGVVFGKVKEPIIRLANVWRTFNAQSVNGIYDFRWVATDFSQAPLSAPSVFNFFSPFYAPAGELKEQGILAPEMQIHTEGTMAKMTNHLHWRVLTMNTHNKPNPEADDILINLDYERDLAITSDEALLDHLDLLMLGGTMSESMRAILLDYLALIESDTPEEKAAEIVAMIVTSTEFSIQQ